MENLMDQFYAVASEAPTTADTVQIWTVLIICLGFCIAVRHLNDFFSGETVTLVEEGTWGGRFKHRTEYGELRKVEKDFAKMYHELTSADEKRKREELRRLNTRPSIEVVDTDSD